MCNLQCPWWDGGDVDWRASQCFRHVHLGKAGRRWIGHPQSSFIGMIKYFTFSLTSLSLLTLRRRGSFFFLSPVTSLGHEMIRFGSCCCPPGAACACACLPKSCKANFFLQEVVKSACQCSWTTEHRIDYFRAIANWIQVRTSEKCCSPHPGSWTRFHVCELNRRVQ